MEYKPGFYVKDGVRRQAFRASDAVALVFDGFRPVDTEAPKAKAVEAEAPVVDEVAKPVSAKPEPPKSKERNQS